MNDTVMHKSNHAEPPSNLSAKFKFIKRNMASPTVV